MNVHFDHRDKKMKTSFAISVLIAIAFAQTSAMAAPKSVLKLIAVVRLVSTGPKRQVTAPHSL